MNDCTCDVKPPRRENAVGRGFSYAIYLDIVDDRTTFDPACPFHGKNGTMIAKVAIKPAKKEAR